MTKTTDEEKYFLSHFDKAQQSLAAIYNAWVAGVSKKDQALILKKLKGEYKIVAQMNLSSQAKHVVQFLLASETNAKVLFEIHGKELTH